MSDMRDDIASVLLSAEEIQARTAELGAQISRDFDGREPLFVGVLKGCFVFMADLMRSVTIPCSVGHKHKAALEHADKQRLAAVEIPGNLGTQLRRARLDLLGGQQNGRNVISHIAHSILPHMSGSVPFGCRSWFAPVPPRIARQRRNRRWPPAHLPRG